MFIHSDDSELVRGGITDGFQAKTGVGVRVSMQRVTCPAACPFNTPDGPCYANAGPVSWYWNRLDRGTAGVTWPELVSQVGGMPLGVWWRWAQAGDCPGKGKNRIDRDKMLELADAARGKPAVGYTHYPVTDGSREALWNLNVLHELRHRGFNLNVSCESLAQVDQAVDRGLTAVVVQPEDSPDTAVTPKGRRGVFCPAQRDDGATTCFGGKGTKACGGGIPLCGRSDRDWFVIFKAHGVRKNALNERFEQGDLRRAA